MNMRQNAIYESLRKMEMELDKSFPILPNSLVVVKYNKLVDLLDTISASIPIEIQEAKKVLKMSDDIQSEAQQIADKLIAEAQNEANRLLSESDILRQVQNQADRIKEEVMAECRAMEKKAQEEAEIIKNQAKDEAIKIKEGAEVYAEQVLAEIEQNLAQLQTVVKNGQVYMEKLRTTSSNLYSTNAVPQNAANYEIE